MVGWGNNRLAYLMHVSLISPFLHMVTLLGQQPIIHFLLELPHISDSLPISVPPEELILD